MRSIIIRYVLIILELYVGFNSVKGGVGLMQNGLGIPLALLKNTPFTSFFLPGLILTFIVGGTQLLAAFMLFKKYTYAYEASFVAGFGIVIWTFTEIFMLRQSHFLQALYFGFGILILVLTLLLLRIKKSW